MAQLRQARITAELRRRGWRVNPKRVYRILREDNLLCVRKRKFIMTTDSNHGRRVYANLAREMILTGVDQLWRADITYIRLQDEFVYLAVILDAFSRRVIGWALDRSLEDELTLAALRMALAHRVVQPGLVHHSDRGSQYASGDYTELLKDRGIAISMSRKANPWDNAACESFIKTLKYEEIHRNEYRDARAIGTNIVQVGGDALRMSVTSKERVRDHAGIHDLMHQYMYALTHQIVQAGRLQPLAYDGRAVRAVAAHDA